MLASLDCHATNIKMMITLSNYLVYAHALPPNRRESVHILLGGNVQQTGPADVIDLAQWHAVIRMRRDAIPFINIGLKPILHRDEGLEASTDMEFTTVYPLRYI